MHTLRLLIIRYPLPTFFVLAIAMPWVFGPLADAIFYAGLPMLLSVALALPFEILVVSPLLAALGITAVLEGKAGVKRLLGQFLRWRVGLLWYAVALLLPPLIYLGAIYLNVLMGAPMPRMAQFGSWSTLLIAFGLRLINPFDGPMMEELGWRGFALPRLQKRFSPITANLILGAVVVLWHLRYLPSGNYAWVYVPGTLAFTLLAGFTIAAAAACCWRCSSM